MASAEQVHQSTAALLTHVGRVNRQTAVQALAPFGLRPHHLVALTVLEEHGEQTQGNLAGAVKIDPTNLVGLLNELESAGLLLRRRDPADRRRHIVGLTDEGHATLADVRRALADAEDRLLAPLDAAEREQLSTLLQRVTAGFVAATHEACGGAEPCDATDAADGDECGTAIAAVGGAPAISEAECTEAIDAVTQRPA